ncbi:MAG: hypothetical protein M0001_16360 [Treponema sp.]|nr:hypothetical protein [Treponema sp.]
MATMPSPQERPDLRDYYDKCDATPDERLAPDVLVGIERDRTILNELKNNLVDEARRKKIDDAESATREAGN